MRPIFLAVLLALTSIYIAPADEGTGNLKSVRFSGLLEEEFGYVMAKNEVKSNFVLSKVELGADASLKPSVDGHVLLLYEQDENEDKVIIDEGTIDLKLPIMLPVELNLSIGRVRIPFCEFNSRFVTDPFTLEIGETKQVALCLSAIHGIVEISAALYNEEVDVGASIATISAT